MTRILAIAAALCLVARAALALNCSALPFTFTNNTTADATQVNANFNSLLTCSNTVLAPLVSPNFSGTVILPDSTAWTSGGLSALHLAGSGSGHITIVAPATASGNVTIPSGTDTVVMLTESQNLTNKTLTGPTITSAGITGGTIDNAVIGGGTPAAGSFTTVSASSTIGGIVISGGVGQTITFPSSSDTVVNLASSQALSNKTLVNPAYSSLASSAGNGSVCFVTGPPFVFASSGSACTVSDGRMKENWGPAPGCKAILQMQAYSYDWRDVEMAKRGRQVGFKAQDIEALIPGAVTTGDDMKITLADGNKEIITKPESLDYARLVVPLVVCMQEMMAHR